MTPKIKSPKLIFEAIKEIVLMSKKTIDNPKISNLFLAIICFLQISKMKNDTDPNIANVKNLGTFIGS